ncbi:response regulator [Chryseobacterium fluminis]|uniref:response regulator transcription factor n=1 Tax=Chryseobacterium fluminis TaxID=2983606 RepID=UPI0022557768|nr:response regulator [Chryseobacterium sp. MMS21-Ot14]UZT97084.1 response regulator [Chryseobacterium sp. MMS21-Ot14]
MKTVFILEDEKNIREALEILLSFDNYNVICCPNVSEFYTKSSTVIPDLYLLDVMLPDGSGIDVCNYVKQTDGTCNVPVIIMSAHAKAIEIDQACRPDAFISKPFNMDDLLDKVAQLTAGTR